MSCDYLPKAAFRAGKRTLQRVCKVLWDLICYCVRAYSDSTRTAGALTPAAAKASVPDWVRSKYTSQ